jgi:excisionase family DNA binding protein
MSDELQELTAEQVAEEMRVHKRRVYRWIEMGDLAAINIGTGSRRNYRISRVDLEDFKRRRRIGPRPQEENT